MAELKPPPTRRVSLASLLGWGLLGGVAAVCLAHGGYLVYTSRWSGPPVGGGGGRDPFDYLLTYVPVMALAFICGAIAGGVFAFKRAARRRNPRASPGASTGAQDVLDPGRSDVTALEGGKTAREP